MIFILFRRRILIYSVSYLRVDLVSNTLEIVHRDQTEQCVLTRHCLFLARTRIYSHRAISITLVPLRTSLWVDDEGCGEITRGEIVITAGGCRLSS